MKKNIGTPGRILRFVLGVFILLYSWWQMSWVAFAIALFVFYEALASWCVLYQFLGKNSCPINHDKD